MKAVVFHDIGQVRLDEVPEPELKEQGDAIVRITASAICGTDLHLVRGTVADMVPGTILGHEGVGIVERIGRDVRNLRVGDRVVIAASIACGYCAYCRSGYYSQCDNANPNGKRAGTAYFGGPKSSGPFHGLQAEKARIPFASVGLVKLPEKITDNQALFLSDIFPTGYFGARLAEICSGDTVAVFGCGPVGQFAIAGAKLHGAGRVFAIDNAPDRLEMARMQEAEVINFDEEDPVEALLRLTGGIGVDRAIDAVGVDSMTAHHGPAAKKARELKPEFDREIKEVAPGTHAKGVQWKPGDAPSQAFLWEVDALAKAGTLAIIGVYPESVKTFPIGMAMNKNITINMGNCNHRKYIPALMELIESGIIDPSMILTQVESMQSAVEAYKAFDLRKPGWMKVELVPEYAKV